jgi:hypothetical protein
MRLAGYLPTWHRRSRHRTSTRVSRVTCLMALRGGQLLRLRVLRAEEAAAADRATDAIDTQQQKSEIGMLNVV